MKGLKKVVLPLLFISFALYIFWMTIDSGDVRATVCMKFGDKTACRSAKGKNRDEALKTAKENACAQLTAGMAQLTACEQLEPVSVEWADEADETSLEPQTP